MIVARQEHDRENLLHEATALVERAELVLLPQADSVVAGFRREGSCSFYFGSDPVYHFNSLGELRRAFCDGAIVKAEQGQLVSLSRQRTSESVRLVSRTMPPDEAREFLRVLQQRLAALRSAITQSTYRLVGQVSAEGEIVPRIWQWLNELGETIALADSPHAR